MLNFITLRFCLSDSIFNASSVKPGAITTSENIFTISVAVSASIVTLAIKIPPKALVGSQDSASIYEANNVSFWATPHGFACLIMANVGLSFLKSSISCRAASISLILL